MNNIIAADIGNSRIKILNDDNLISMDYSEDWTRKIKKFIPDYSRVFYSSVNPSMEDILIESSEITENIDFINAKIILEKEEHIKYRHIHGIGTDRVLGLLGAISIDKAPLITVDCGTAVTVNVVDANSKIIGGAIFAGVYTQLNALLHQADEVNNAYEKVPEKDFVELLSTLEPAGDNTKDALKSGIINSVVGGIANIIKKINFKYFNNDDVKIFTTGGYGKIISDSLNEEGLNARYVQTLVLEGILHLSNKNI